MGNQRLNMKNDPCGKNLAVTPPKTNLKASNDDLVSIIVLCDILCLRLTGLLYTVINQLEDEPMAHIHLQI